MQKQHVLSNKLFADDTLLWMSMNSVMSPLLLLMLNCVVIAKKLSNMQISTKHLNGDDKTEDVNELAKKH